MWSKLLRVAQVMNAVPSPPAGENAQVRVLFVCMGNVCRSPMAAGTLRRLLEDMGLTEQVYVDAAGTHLYHSGAVPDARGQQVAARRGVDLRAFRSRQVTEADFTRFDYLLAMDQDNYQYLQKRCPQSDYQERIQLFLDYAPQLPEREVPDPYYGSLIGFERVMDLVEAAAEGLLLHLRERHQL
jgi:protein-tyrosine phosphatase